MNRCVAAVLAALTLLTPAAQATGSGTAAGLARNLTEIQLTAQAQKPAEEDWQLILVNPWNKLPEDFQVELKKLSNGLRVDARIYDDLSAMLSDCRKAGLSPLVCSAYRSQETQTRLYRNKISRLRAAGYTAEKAVQEAGRWVAVPGTSEHQTGLAVDLVAASYQILDQKQEQTAEQKWLMEHCWEYGFILRYPTDKSEITGIGYEPWHYRYVGKTAAAAIHDSGLCLEEYLQQLEAEPGQATVEK
nr:M15 family metallopeptidase [uncultured Oscillibacter sp.]